ncbi:PREDICTED: uncharacterized protein LOC100633575 [Amphimedon queenslandica]|uniref:CARD domain-containing protein n=2 Tax=Amphimedon queenslandica TaxID=400682 RepID=A0AAN0IJH5_AMPQE|nr:PREDICTED: uncharacterized protein LOC100633575 [Amphimedon queenslandica]|eukprot:XP_003391457.1 PREDICTED: uncharacterized protein LOC100633575 [Amphimedon queenslandica]
MASNEEVVERNILRKMRRVLLEEMPEPRDLIEDERFGRCISGYEKVEVASLKNFTERVEKFINFLEWKGPDFFESFLKVLPDYRPSLEKKLREERDSIERKMRFKDIHNHHKGAANGKDEAGTTSFNDSGPGPSYHISHISYSGIQLLADHLNDSKTFKDFCQAMRVDRDLIVISQRSLNPTACLLQEIQNDPEATMERLSEALESIGKGELYSSLLQLMN